MTPTPRYLVFGATGHIGGATARTLEAQAGAATVRVATSRSDAVAALGAAFPGSEAVRVDLRDVATVIPAVGGIEAIFVVNPDFFPDADAARALLAAVEVAGTRPHIVRLQAEIPGVTIDRLEGRLAGPGPRRGHLEARAAIERSGLPSTFLNSLAYFMDDFTRHFAPTLRGSRRLVIPFERPMCFIDPAEIGEAAAGLMLSRSVRGLIHLNNGEDGTPFREVAAMIAAVTGVSIGYDPDPDVFRAELGGVLNQISGNDDALEYLLADWRMEQAHASIYVGNDRLASILGRSPRTLRMWLEAHRGQLLSGPDERG